MSGRLRYLILANFLCAFGYSLKNLSESTLLHDCIEIGKHSNSQFAKINGKGSAFYYVFDAISTALTGFLYIYNAYLPLFLCMIFCIISTIISYTFEDYTDPKIKKQKTSNPDYNYISELISSFKFIFPLQYSQTYFTDNLIKQPSHPAKNPKYRYSALPYHHTIFSQYHV